MEKTKYGTASESEIKAGLVKIVSKRMFFGHQSVGKNLMDGLGEVSSRIGVAAPVFTETRTADTITGPGFYHASVGKNTDPLGKLKDFDAILRGGVGAKVDVAFLKFCYVDITEGTDVDALFGAYKATMARLQADFPGVQFIHFTAPLTWDKRGAVAMLKRFLGRQVPGYEDNVAREKYNSLVRAEFGATATVFDIAAVESTAPDGTRLVNKLGMNDYFVLRDEYTTDGGHLNGTGKDAVAGWFAVEFEKAVR